MSGHLDVQSRRRQAEESLEISQKAELCFQMLLVGSPKLSAVLRKGSKEETRAAGSENG